MTKIVTSGGKDNRFRIAAKLLPEINHRTRLDVFDEMQQRAEKTVATWDDPATFEPVETQRSIEMVTSSDKWFWLNKGTKVRHAVMSKDWQSKTRPGDLMSGPGEGDVVFVSMKINLPGIAKRGWSEIIVKEVKPLVKDLWRKNARAVRGF